MQNFERTLFLSAIVGSLSFGVSRPAHALLEECGNIELDGNAECELQVEGGCDILCEPPQLTVACAGELYVDCRAECQGELDVGCTADCSADCQAECDVDPGNFSCEGRCEASCDANCEGECGAGADGAECRASCEATCSGECDASCEGQPPSATCEAQCEASCTGECRAEANLDCQADCQAEGYVDCKVDMQGKCEAQCTRPDGALVCDGQFIDAADVDACVGAIQDALDIEVEASGSADADCQGNECRADAEGSVSCAVAPLQPSGQDSGNGWWLAVGAALGLTHLRRRRSAAR